MTHLRKIMLEELQRRNYAQDTTRFYIRTVEDFSRRFNRPPDRLGPRHVREKQFRHLRPEDNWRNEPSRRRIASDAEISADPIRSEIVGIGALLTQTQKLTVLVRTRAPCYNFFHKLSNFRF